LVAQVVGLLSDSSAAVVEAACYALGELGQGDGPVQRASLGRGAGAGSAVTPEVGPATVRALGLTATSHGDALCREAAVAALGAIASPEGLPAVLSALDDKAAVRRRAVIALAAFEGAEVEAALVKSLGDVDWQVRQAAEDLLGARSRP